MKYLQIPRLLAILCCGLISPALAAPTTAATTQPSQTGQFLRFVDDGAGGGKLESAIVTYRNPAGVTVHLVAAVHVGEKSYYQSLNKTFETYDALLYEMVKAKGAKPPAPGERAHNAVSAVQRFLKNALALDFQLDDIDYTRPNFIHADLDAEDFFARQEERGESFFRIMLRSMLREMERSAEAAPRKTAPPTLLDLLVALRAPDRARQLKLLLARQFDDIEDQTAAFNGPDGSVILTDRNKKCIETLKQAIQQGHRNLGIYYGAAHMGDLSQRLQAMGFKKISTEWRVGWDMTAPPATKPAETEKQN